ncbi:MAG: accessory gene regulator B family protein [Bacilli bacterium]
MEKWFLNKSINNIKNSYPNYSETKIEEIRYGLEAVYLTITKLIIILIISCFLGIIKDVLILLLLFGGIRNFAYGIHASKSLICLLASSTIFMGVPYLAREITLPPHTMLGMAFICIVLYFIYAPADTEKRPLVNEKKRLLFKLITTFIVICYTVILLLINDNYYKNLILFAMIMELLMILPITYKMFGEPYNNYKK